MNTSLDQRMADLLDDVPLEECCHHPVVLEMGEHTAAVVVEGLRWALYGGAQPPDGRRSLLLVLDAIQMALVPKDVV